MQFPDSLREMSRLRGTQHIRAGTRVCEKRIIGEPRRKWENNITFIPKYLHTLNMHFSRVVKYSKVGKKFLHRSSSSI